MPTFRLTAFVSWFVAYVRHKKTRVVNTDKAQQETCSDSTNQALITDPVQADRQWAKLVGVEIRATNFIAQPVKTNNNHAHYHRY